jgi:hypothetical protein
MERAEPKVGSVIGITPVAAEKSTDNLAARMNARKRKKRHLFGCPKVLNDNVNFSALGKQMFDRRKGIVLDRHGQRRSAKSV